MRVLDSNLPLLHPEHTPRSISELKDIALQTLDRKVFIHRSNHQFAGLEHDGVVSRIRNRTARRDCRQSRTSAATQSLVDGVVMQVSRSPATLGRKSLREHAHDRVKLFTFQIAIGICTSDGSKKIVFRPLFGSDSRDDLLGQNIKRLFGNLETIQLTAANRIDNRRTLN